MLGPSSAVRRVAGVRRVTADGVTEASVDGLDVHLSPLAAFILEALDEDEPSTPPQITASAVGEFGEPDPPATAADLVAHHLHDLAAHGLVTIDGGGRVVAGRMPTQDAVEVIRSALRHALGGATAEWRPPVEVEDDVLLSAATRHHVVPLLARHLDTLAFSPRVAAALRAEAARRASAAAALAEEMARVSDALTGAGVRGLMVKGLALARQAHGDWTLRGAGDLDLLVPPTEVAAAHSALTAIGYLPGSGFPEPGPSWSWRAQLRLSHELTLHHGRHSIDMHWHLVPTHDTFPPFDVLWQRRDTVDVAGHLLPTLGRYDALTHSAGHASKDHWRWLRSLADVHQLTSDPETWRQADRPLRHDQLLSVGLAARVFGVPAGAPSVVDEAVLAAGEVWPDAIQRQDTATLSHAVPGRPGLGLVGAMRAMARTEASPREIARLLGVNVFTPWLSARETSPRAVVAVPRIVRARQREVISRLRRRPGVR